MQLAAETRQPGNWVAAALSRRQRSQIVSNIMLSLFLPAITAATNSEDHANTKLDLTRIGAALAIYRIETGSYPEKLKDVVPLAIGQLRLDPFSGKPFLYKRTDDGYVLYSVGENGKDDKASNERDRILNGQSMDDFDQAKAEARSSPIPPGADDISIRIPRPAFELPKASPQPE
jgi:hypothetical protein